MKIFKYILLSLTLILTLNVSAQVLINSYVSSTVADNGKVTITGKTKLYSLGNSITAGQFATTASERFINQLAAQTGLTLTNAAVAGSGIRHNSGVIQNAAIDAQTLVTCMVGLNDNLKNGNSATKIKTQKKIEAGYRSIVLKCLRGNTTASGSSSVTRSGSFSSVSVQGVGGTFAGSALPSNSASFNTGGASASWTWTCPGTSFGVQMIGSTDNLDSYGTCGIFIDNVLVKTVDTREWYDNVVEYAGTDTRRGAVAFTFFDLGPGPHTIRVQANGDGFILLDFFAELNAPASTPAILFSEIPYLNSTGYATAPAQGTAASSDELSAIIEAIVNEYRGKGYNIGYVPMNDFLTLNNLSPDGIHWTDAGHDQGTAAFLSKIQL